MNGRRVFIGWWGDKKVGWSVRVYFFGIDLSVGIYFDVWDNYWWVFRGILW